MSHPTQLLCKRILLSNTLLVRFRGRPPVTQIEDEVARQSTAFSLLATIPRVHLEVGSLHARVRKLLPVVPQGDKIELSSNELKKIIKATSSSITVIDDRADPPVFSLTTTFPETNMHRSPLKSGVNLSKGERGKTIRMSVNIDDHMLSIRVKQATEFLLSNRVVMVSIRLPGSSYNSPLTDSKQNGSPPDSESDISKKQRLKALWYQSEAQRFVIAFSTIPSANVRLMERPKMNEIALLIKPAARAQKA